MQYAQSDRKPTWPQAYCVCLLLQTSARQALLERPTLFCRCSRGFSSMRSNALLNKYGWPRLCPVQVVLRERDVAQVSVSQLVSAQLHHTHARKPRLKASTAPVKFVILQSPVSSPSGRASPSVHSPVVASSSANAMRFTVLRPDAGLTGQGDSWPEEKNNEKRT